MGDTPSVLPADPPRDGGLLLVVEDNDADVRILRLAIEQTKVLLPLGIARDGEQAIEYLTGRGSFADRKLYPVPSLMLLDLRMPRKSGLEVLAWMKKEGVKSPKVIVFTSSAEHEDIRRAYELGAIAYIVKPVSVGPLREIVRGLATFLRNTEAPIDGALGWHIRPLL